MTICDKMSDSEINFTGAIFALALERKIFAETLIERSILSVAEIDELYNAAFDIDTETLRCLLNKVYGSLK